MNLKHINPVYRENFNSANLPLVSVVIATIGRDTLSRAVESILEQDMAKLVEVIVVNDSGKDLTTIGPNLIHPQVTIITTNRRKQSAARNVGAAIARGQFLMFLDDDDYLAPGSLTELHEVLVDNPQLIVAYGGVLLQSEKGESLGRLNLGVSGNCSSQLLAGALILLGTALIRTDAFFGVGGLNLTLTTSEETELFRRLAMIGDFGNSPKIILFVLRGSGWHSSQDYSPAVDILRHSREEILSKKGAFGRLNRSATEPYWKGRVVKAYLASAFWNIHMRRFWRTISRIMMALFAVILALGSIFHISYWQALRDTQIPTTILRALPSSIDE